MKALDGDEAGEEIGTIFLIIAGEHLGDWSFGVFE